MRYGMYIFVLAIVAGIGVGGFAAQNLYTSPGGMPLTSPGGASLTSPRSSPIGSPTVPPSIDGSGIVLNALSQYRVEGNLIITGNVTGGRHFRGIVPYGSTTEFDFGPLNMGSTSLNSFIRRSAGQPYLDRSPGAVQPYYLPSQTVTSLKRNGASGLSVPRVTFDGGTGKFAPLPAPGSEPVYRQQRPLSLDTAELEKLINKQLDLDLLRLDALEKELQELDARDVEQDEARKLDVTKLEPLDLTKEPKRLFDESLQPPLPDTPESVKEAMQKKLDAESKSDIFEQELLGHLKLDGEEQAEPDVETEKEEQHKIEPPKPSEEGQESQGYDLKLQAPEDLPEPDHALARKILGEHKDFKSLARAKVGEYMKAAEEFMAEGKYYRAADAYILANIWDSEYAEAYVGRAHALFAAGEYMSSSYFLAKAFTLAPEYALRKVDLVALVGDRDLLEDRVIEIVAWQKKSNSGELAFILAYVFHHTDKPYAAREVIAIAAEKMPDDPAVDTLKKVIEAGAGTGG